jgi:hypothetical protein
MSLNSQKEQCRASLAWHATCTYTGHGGGGGETMTQLKRMAPFAYRDGGKAIAHRLSERNDCVVRALACASGISYQDAYDLASWHGRQRNRGTLRAAVLFDALFPGARLFWATAFRRDPLNEPRPTTLGRFIEAHPLGRFLCLKRGHAFAVVDGVVHDSAPIGKGTKLLYAVQVA